MKRRPFLAGLSALGASTFVNFKASAQENEKNANLELSVNLSENVTSIKTWENENISFEWYSDASARIVVKSTNTIWLMGPVAMQEEEAIDRGHVWVRQERSFCEQYSGRFSGKIIEDNKIRFSVYDLSETLRGSFTVNVQLKKEQISIEISQIDEKLPNLMFPTPIENDMMVLPMGVGKLIRKPVKSRFFHTWYSHLNMRFFGGLKGNDGYIAIFENGFEDAGISVSEMSVNPVWQKSLGKYKENQNITYAFTSNGYVGIAKLYRKWCIENGIFKTLDDKIKQTPQLKNLIGGRMASFYQAFPSRTKDQLEDMLRINDLKKKFKNQNENDSTSNDGENNPSTRIAYTHKETLKLMSNLKKVGMKKGVFNIRGWIKGGYDAAHPDVWPPEPSLGTVEELKQICAESGNFTTVLHDNYMDMYKRSASFPKGIIVDKNGVLMRGGYWAGGQAYIMNYKAGLAYAKRNWEYIKSLNIKGMFVDTVTAVQLYETYEKDNQLTKADDLKYKIETIKFYKEKNQIFGSEESADFGIPYTDWYENRHKRVAGESIPLWPLVFHDCALNARYIDPTNVPGEANYWLEDMLWGYFILFRLESLKNLEWAKQEQAFKETLHVDDWMAQIGTLEMTNHEYLSDDFQAERTTFSNGKSITINFSNAAKTIDGKEYKPFEYQIAG